MLKTLARLEADRHINAAEFVGGMNAQLSGADEHTIGYEFELLPTTAPETPQITRNDLLGSQKMDKLDIVSDALEPYGYKVGADGIYELRSPGAKHPIALGMATRGLVRMGWLPEAPRGVVTSHVSIGYSMESWQKGVEREDEYHLINILRAVELAGGTTPGRLNAPVTMGRQMQKENGSSARYSWNVRGQAGVNKDASLGFDWEGNNDRRIEFRTLRYQTPDQFEKTLANLYFLSRGLLAPSGSPASGLYKDFEGWFEEYRQTNSMPDIRNILRRGDNLKHLTVMEDYIKPYVASLAQGGDKDLKIKINQTIECLAEEFGMSLSADAKELTVA